jgi:hypothetical protein
MLKLDRQNQGHQALGTGDVMQGIDPHLEGGHTTLSATPISKFLDIAPYVLLSIDAAFIFAF